MPDQPIEEGNSRLDALEHQIAKRREREEERGVEHKGIRWRTDASGRQAVIEALQFATVVEAQGETFETDWKGQDGKWATGVTRSDLEQVVLLFGKQRRASLSRERTLLESAQGDPDGFNEVEMGDGWPWVQPAGSHDAYPLDAKVTFNDKTWISLIDYNVHQPPTNWREVTDGVSAWVQPTGAGDAYNSGDLVTHDNPNDGGAIWVYRSTIDANTTEPGRDGDFDRWWEPVSLASDYTG